VVRIDVNLACSDLGKGLAASQRHHIDKLVVQHLEDLSDPAFAIHSEAPKYRSPHKHQICTQGKGLEHIRPSLHTPIHHDQDFCNIGSFPVVLLQGRFDLGQCINCGICAILRSDHDI
jgi:hypothetical protein